MSNVRALRMHSLMSSKRIVGIAVPAPVLRSRWLSVLAASKHSFSSSRTQSAFSSVSAKVGLLPRCAVQSWHCSLGLLAMSVQIRSTRALRADVLRRAISSLSRRLAPACLFPSTFRFPRHSGSRSCYLSRIASFLFINQRPNWSVERTCNSRAHFQCALPSHAAHLQR